MPDLDLQHLHDLIHCHATPGDEGAVFALLRQRWQQAGWTCRQFGACALAAEHPNRQPGRPELLFCAHADSPGYIVQSITHKEARAIRLGGPAPDDNLAELRAKNPAGELFSCRFLRFDGEENDLIIAADPRLTRSSRLTFQPGLTLTADNYIHAPALDNRLGCLLLTALVESLPADLPCNIRVAVTAMEEFTGFGAAVLARQCPADLVICLDATYEDPLQEVRLGDGPVLTLSDRSVLVPPPLAIALQTFCRQRQLPLQTEIYNFSGTDAKAFPLSGNPAPVLPILVPTRGNHSPCETATLADCHNTLYLCRELALAHDTRQLLLASCCEYNS